MAVRHGPRRISAAAGLAVGLAMVVTDAEARDGSGDNSFPLHLRRMMDHAVSSGSLGVVTATAKMAARVSPRCEAELLSVVAARAPSLVPTLAYSLGLRAIDARMAMETGPLGGAGFIPAAEPQGPSFFSRAGWNASLIRGVTGQFGRVRLTERAFDVALRRDAGPVTYRMDLQMVGSNGIGTVNRDRLVGRVLVAHDLSDRVFIYGQAEGERDTAIGYDRRTAVSSGLGYHVTRSAGMSWDLQAGPAIRQQQAIGFGSSETHLGGAVESRITWQGAGSLRLENTSAVLTAGATTLANRTRMAFPVSDSVSMGLSNELRYDFAPVAGRDGFDATTTASVSVTF